MIVSGVQSVILKQLTEEKELTNHLYCFERNDSYLNELNALFPAVVSRIVAVFEDYKRFQGDISIENCEISVCPTQCIKNVDWANASLLITSDYFYEAYEKIIELFEEASSQDASFSCPKIIYYFVNKETAIDLAYRKKYQNEELRDIILFRSGPHSSSYVKGMDFSDNARALFEYMLHNQYNERYELVWMVRNPESYGHYSQYKNVTFVSDEWSTSEETRELEEYYRVLCLSKYIFFTDAYGFARNARKDQVRIQLWHGCGFKTRVNFVPCDRRYEYNIVIGEIYKKIHANIYGLRDEQVLVTGYPKTDWLFEELPNEKIEHLGIPMAKKYIFWLPTFRNAKAELNHLTEESLYSETGLPILDSFDKLDIVNSFLAAHNTLIIVKLHPFQDKSAIRIEKMTNIILLENEQLVDCDLQINQLLTVADALISDYSSAAVDFLLLNRPIAFTLDDVLEYENSRGFVFENIRDWLPGEEIVDFRDYLGFLREIVEGEDSSKDKREKLLSKMHLYKDGNSCQRVLETLNIL